MSIYADKRRIIRIGTAKQNTIESVDRTAMDIGIIGLGFVGLTTALGFADKGYDVYGYDIDDVKNAALKNGVIPFHEPGLGGALKSAAGFVIEDSIEKTVRQSDIVFICVGTPASDNSGADLSFLLNAAEEISGCVRDGKRRLMVIKSTVPPGTTAGTVIPHLKNRIPDFDDAFEVAVNPEFLREGHCWEDFTNPDRIVCGVGGEWAEGVLLELYAPFDAPVRFVALSTAEFIKYLSNALLASLISFSNEMAQIAEHIGGIDIGAAFHILHEDKRWSGAGINHYIYPGCGYGGYCLPKDTAALSVRSKQYGFEPHILDGVISLNNKMPIITARKIECMAGGRESKIGILGLSFKPNSDDIRDTPAAKIIKRLIEDGYDNIFAYDPMATSAFRDMYGLDITYCGSKEEVCEVCDVVAVVTVWGEFEGIDKALPNVHFVDCRYSL